MRARRIVAMSMSFTAASFLAACGGGSKATTNTTPPNTITTSGSNVVPIQVNSGPDPTAFTYVNGAFVSVTVCVPGTSTCQTIPEVLVDTGSVGLRIVSQDVLTVALPQQTSGGQAVAECLQFLDSYTWGPVDTADVTIGGEKASSVPVQVLSDTDFQVPSGCGAMTPGLSADTVATLGANGILGVGIFPQDCGSTCAASFNQYFSCASATAACTAISQSAADQVTNPVILFPKDNNGVIIELPQTSEAATVNGSLVFGIGTESNNGLGGATVYTIATTGPNIGAFNTDFNGTSYPGSFVDSGSNGYFFPDSSITQCSSTSNAFGFYCPGSTVNLSATNSGVTAGSGTVNFSVGNAGTLFSDDPSDAGLGDLAGPTMLPTGSAASSPDYFDWGLPFFYGRNVFVAIEGQTATGGTTPYWAY